MKQFISQIILQHRLVQLMFLSIANRRIFLDVSFMIRSSRTGPLQDHIFRAV